MLGRALHAHAHDTTRNVDFAAVVNAASDIGIDTARFCWRTTDGDVEQAITVEIKGRLRPGGQLYGAFPGLDDASVGNLGAQQCHHAVVVNGDATLVGD
ncbi:hypothetical protein D3C77_423150 [compost metagenome]